MKKRSAYRHNLMRMKARWHGQNSVRHCYTIWISLSGIGSMLWWNWFTRCCWNSGKKNSLSDLWAKAKPRRNLWNVRREHSCCASPKVNLVSLSNLSNTTISGGGSYMYDASIVFIDNLNRPIKLKLSQKMFR